MHLAPTPVRHRRGLFLGLLAAMSAAVVPVAAPPAGAASTTVPASADAKVAQSYGMIHPGASETVTVRTVYFIDPTQTVRAVIYYPLNVGRNMDEILRTLEALQTVTKHGVACPANWKPGDKVIVPAPITYEGMQKRLNEEGIERKDWWLSKKTLG